MKRQNVRKLVIISSFLLFPITIYYLSPYIIIQGALNGIITGSFIVFMAMLVGSVFFGRLFCAYICPAGGLQECAAFINNKNPKQGWKNKIKYVIWAIWIAAIILCFIFRNQKISVDFFYFTDHGISIANIYGYIIYYFIVLLFFVPAVAFGKRTICHYLCWMAPFMVIGYKVGRLLHIRQFKLEADKNSCISCHTCDKNCPMGLKVEDKVKTGRLYDSECILCGACIDNCPKKVIHYKI